MAAPWRSRGTRRARLRLYENGLESPRPPRARTLFARVARCATRLTSHTKVAISSRCVDWFRCFFCDTGGGHDADGRGGGDGVGGVWGQRQGRWRRRPRRGRWWRSNGNGRRKRGGRRRRRGGRRRKLRGRRRGRGDGRRRRHLSSRVRRALLWAGRLRGRLRHLRSHRAMRVGAMRVPAGERCRVLRQRAARLRQLHGHRPMRRHAHRVVWPMRGASDMRWRWHAGPVRLRASMQRQGVRRRRLRRLVRGVPRELDVRGGPDDVRV